MFGVIARECTHDRSNPNIAGLQVSENELNFDDKIAASFAEYSSVLAMTYTIMLCFLVWWILMFYGIIWA